MKLFPENISTYGNEIDELFWLILILSGIALVISLFILFFPLIKYNCKKTLSAKHIAGTGWKQLKWIAIPVILLAFSDFAILTKEHGTWVKIMKTPEQHDFHIAAIGKQWNWIFQYPGPDGKLYTGDDIFIDEQNSELHVPVNKTVMVDIKARDVLHSFFLPNLRFKYDAIPGRTVVRWFNATKTGKYEIICAEICGVLHSKMRNFLVVDSQADFEKYMNELYQRKLEN